MPERKSLPTESETARVTRLIMKRQAGLSIRVASVFLVLILGLPLVNRFAPALSETSIGGFPATWLFLGLLFYPITVALSVFFVRASDSIEAECKTYFDNDGEGADR